MSIEGTSPKNFLNESGFGEVTVRRGSPSSRTLEITIPWEYAERHKIQEGDKFKYIANRLLIYSPKSNTESLIKTLLLLGKFKNLEEYLKNNPIDLNKVERIIKKIREENQES